jgi:hypothetical protein
MKRRDQVFITMLFFVGIIILQTLLRFSVENLPQLQQQTGIIQSRDIDPSALFYTDSKLALQAEKQVRQQIQKPR